MPSEEAPGRGCWGEAALRALVPVDAELAAKAHRARARKCGAIETLGGL